MNPDIEPKWKLLALSRALAAKMDEPSWYELGELTNSSEIINDHPRLIRSYRFGDEDYLGCIRDVLPAILGKNGENFELLATYLDLKNYLEENQKSLYRIMYDPTESSTASDVASVKEPVCFVIMPFSEPINSYYKTIIHPAIVEVGLNPLRADEITESGVLVNQIWTGIRRATICVAELTGQNSNVMYELGLAHALRKPVVSLVQSISDVPFDLKHLRQIVYQTHAADWSQKLKGDLVSMLKGTLANPKSGIIFE